MHELNERVAHVAHLSAALAGFEEYMTALAPEGGKKSRAKAFRIPGLGKRDKEPDSTWVCTSSEKATIHLVCAISVDGIP